MPHPTRASGRSTAAPLVDAEDTDLADEGSPVPAGDDSTVPVESTAALALVGSTRREPSETTGAGPSGEPGVVAAAAQSAGITVNSVDVAFGDGVVNGAIDAVSSRGEPLNPFWRKSRCWGPSCRSSSPPCVRRRS
ncbi:MAG: hypothetical protein K0U76_13190 [Actinomycetia bacterium]|nr:hypothetical protein [Actinomycetes bacterium]MCH9702308.1 hypothetical protein [Actinomycetes bacterium]MCH9762324.1 hypothetical protein [Actinomycetes bacterium]